MNRFAVSVALVLLRVYSATAVDGVKELRRPAWLPEVGAELAEGDNWRRRLDASLNQAPGLEVDEWWLVGPFPFPDRKQRVFGYGPEKGFDPERTYKGARGEVAWRKVDAEGGDSSRYVDYTKFLEPQEEGVAYTYTQLDVPESRIYWCWVLYDDTLDIWLDGRKVHANPSYGRVTEIFPILLTSGRHDLIVQVAQGVGGWGLQMRFFPQHPRRIRIAALYALMEEYQDEPESLFEMLLEVVDELRAEGEKRPLMDVLGLLCASYLETLSRPEQEYQMKRIFDRLVELDCYRQAFQVGEKALSGEISNGYEQRYCREMGDMAAALGMTEEAVRYYRRLLEVSRDDDERGRRDARRRLASVEKALLADPVALPVSEELAEDLRRAGLTRQMGRWSQYARSLHEMLEHSRKYLVRREDGTITGPYMHLLDLIRNLPPETRCEYDEIFGPALKARIESPEVRRHPFLLEKAARSDPGLPEASSALTRAGDLYMEAGRFDSALRCFRDLLERMDARPETAARLLAAAARMGAREEFDDVAARFAGSGVIGYSGVGFDRFVQELSGLMHGDSAGRKEFSFQELKECRALRFEFIPGCEGADAAASRTGLPYVPVAGPQGGLFMQTETRLWVLGRNSEPLWWVSTAGLDPQMNEIRAAQYVRDDADLGRVILKPAVDGRRVAARLMWPDEEPGDPRWCLASLGRANGRLLWSTLRMKEFEGMVPCSNPVLCDGLVACLWLKPRDIDDVVLMVQDAADGRVLYSLPVCSGNLTGSGGDLSPAWLGAAITFLDGTLYMDTAAGVVAAVDLFNGAFIWAARYPRRTDWSGADRYRFLSRGDNAPLVAGEAVICRPRDSEFLVALSAKTGRVLWRVLSNATEEAVGTVRDAEGRLQVVLVEQGRLLGCDVSSGKVLWDWLPPGGVRPGCVVSPTDGTIVVQGRDRLYRVFPGGGSPVEAMAYPVNWRRGRFAVFGGGLAVLGPDRLDIWRPDEPSVRSHLPGGRFAAESVGPEAGTRCEPGTQLRCFVPYQARSAYVDSNLPGGHVLLEAPGMLALVRVTPLFEVLWRVNLPRMTRWRIVNPQLLLVLMRHELQALHPSTGETLWRASLPSSGGRLEPGKPFEFMALCTDTVAAAGPEEVLVMNLSDGGIIRRWDARECLSSGSVQDIACVDGKLAVVFHEGRHNSYGSVVLDARTGDLTSAGTSFSGIGYHHRMVGTTEEGLVIFYARSRENLPLEAFDVFTGDRKWNRELDFRGEWSSVSLRKGWVLLNLPRDSSPRTMVLDAASGRDVFRNNEELWPAVLGESQAVLLDTAEERGEKAHLICVRLPSWRILWERQTEGWDRRRPEQRPRVSLDEQEGMVAWVVPRPGREDDELSFHWSDLRNGEDVHSVNEGGLAVSSIALVDGALAVLLPGWTAVFSEGLPELPEGAPPADVDVSMPEQAALVYSQKQLEHLIRPAEYKSGWLREVDAKKGAGRFWNQVPQTSGKDLKPWPSGSSFAVGGESGTGDASVKVAVARDEDVLLHVEIRDDNLLARKVSCPDTGDVLDLFLGNPQPGSLRWGPWRDRRYVRIRLLPGEEENEPEYNVSGRDGPSLIARRYDYSEDAIVCDFRIPSRNCLSPAADSTYPEETPVEGLMGFAYTDDDGEGERGRLVWGGLPELPFLMGHIHYMPRKGEFAPPDPILRPGEELVLRQGSIRLGRGEGLEMTWKGDFVVRKAPSAAEVRMWIADTAAIDDPRYGGGFYGAGVAVNGEHLAWVIRLRGTRVNRKEKWMEINLDVPEGVLKEGINELEVGYIDPESARQYAVFDVARVRIELKTK